MARGNQPGDVREAITPADRAAYRAELEELLRQSKKMIGDDTATVLATFGTLRERLVGIINTLGDTPTRAMYSRALINLDASVAEWGTRLDVSFSDMQARHFDLGARIATDPLSAAGIQGLVHGTLAEDVAILGLFRAGLVGGVSEEVKKRIGLEIAGIASGAATPLDAVTRIGSSLSSPNHFTSIAARAQAIMVTELGRANALGTQRSQEQHAEVIPGLRKRWISAHLPRARRNHIEVESKYRIGGSTGPILIDDAFEVGGFLAKFPRDASLPARESVHCRCQSITVLPEELEETPVEIEPAPRVPEPLRPAPPAKPAPKPAPEPTPPPLGAVELDDFDWQGHPGTTVPRIEERKELLDAAFARINALPEPMRSDLIYQLEQVGKTTWRVATESTTGIRKMGSFGGHVLRDGTRTQNRPSLMLHLSRQIDEWDDWVMLHNSEVRRLRNLQPTSAVPMPVRSGMDAWELLNLEPSRWRLATADELAGTLIHELGHAIDFFAGGLGRPFGISGTAEGRELLNLVWRAKWGARSPVRGRANRAIFNYATSGVNEAFAEVMRFYFNGTVGEAGDALVGKEVWEIFTAEEWRAEFGELALWLEENVINR